MTQYLQKSEIINPYYEIAKEIEADLGGNIDQTLDGIEYRTPEYNQVLLCGHCNTIDAWRKISVGTIVCNSCGSVRVFTSDDSEEWSICRIGYYDKQLCNHNYESKLSLRSQTNL